MINSGELRDIFADWSRRLEIDSQLSALDARYQWRIEGEGGGCWILNCNQQRSIVEGVSEAVDCEVVLSVRDFQALVSGVLNPQEALLDGRLKLYGDWKKALLMNRVLDKLIESQKVDSYH